MRDPGVWQLLQRYDVLITTETHGMQRAAAADGLPGFVPFHADRARAAGEAVRAHHGVAVFVKAGVSAAFEHVQLSGEGVYGCEVVWLRVKREHTPGSGGLLLGACYLAPESSSAYKPLTKANAAVTVFEALGAQIAALRRSDEPVLIAGDLNARAGKWVPGGAGLADIADPEGLPAQLDWHMGGAGDSLDPVLRPARPNEDEGTNFFGRELCQLCCQDEMLICNGRLAGDPTGAKTFEGANGSSTVDLYVASAELFPRCERLAVLPMQRSAVGVAVSDHRPVELVLDLDVCGEPGKPAPRRKSPPSKAFGPREWAQYSAALAGPMGQATLAELQACAEALAAGSLTATAAVEALGKMLARVRRRVANGVQQAGPAGPKPDAPWWTADCSGPHDLCEARRRETQGQPRTSRAWRVYRAARTAWNRVRRKAKADFAKAQLRELIKECHEDPRRLWERLRGPRPVARAIPAERWKEHFETLLNAGHAEEAEAGEVDRAWELLNVINGLPRAEPVEALLECEGVAARRTAAEAILNAPLALEEVEGALRRLPNGKARGPEAVPAEAYKHAKGPRDEGSEPGPAPNLLAPFLTALFDHIFASGDLPNQFTVAHLTPVYKRKGDDGDPGSYRGITVAGALARPGQVLCNGAVEAVGEAWGGCAGSVSPKPGRVPSGAEHNAPLTKRATPHGAP